MKTIIILVLAVSLMRAQATPCGSTVGVTVSGVSYVNSDYPFTDSLNGVFTLRRYGNYDHSEYCHYSFLSRPNQYGVSLVLSVQIYDGEIYVQETLVRQGLPLQAQVFIGEGTALPLENEITQNGGSATVQ